MNVAFTVPSQLCKPIVRWSLRTLLLVVTIACALLAGWRYYLEPYRIQHQAAKVLSEKGGYIEWRASGPSWLRGVIGAETMRDVVRIELQLGQFYDQDLQHLSDLPHTYNLIIKSTHVTDQGLVHLQNLSELSDLVLADAAISDHGLTHLSSLKNLRKLMIYGDSSVTPHGIESLKAKLPNLEVEVIR